MKKLIAQRKQNEKFKIHRNKYDDNTNNFNYYIFHF